MNDPQADVTEPTAEEQSRPEHGQEGPALAPHDASANINEQEAAPAPDEFVAELARAARAAARAQHEALAARLDAVTASELERIRSRGGAEAKELREQAERDIAGVRAWARIETRRIKDEADKRVAERRRRLDAQVAEQGGAIDDEADRLQAAIAEYRASVEAFFTLLDEETDPTEFARLASQLPRMPNFQALVPPKARAVAPTPTEPAGVVAESVAEPAAGPDATESLPPAAETDETRREGQSLAERILKAITS